MKKYVVIIVIVLCLAAGYIIYINFVKIPVVTLYIENNSYDFPKVGLKIHIDKKLIVDDVFKVDSVAPSFSTYKLQLNKGRHVIDISSTALKAGMIDTVEIREDKYVFINFNYKLKSKYLFEQEKIKFELSYPKEKYPGKIFEFDSIEIKPEVKIYVTGERPTLH